MGHGDLRCLSVFILSLFVSSGSGVAETPPPLEAIQKNKAASGQGNRILFSSSLSTTQLDTNAVPIVNPTTPGTATPTVNPIESPPPATGITTPINPPASTSPPVTATPTSAGGATPINPPASTSPPVTATPTPAGGATPINPPASTSPPSTATPTSAGVAWCIASPTASPTALQVALDYACGYGGADCSTIQPGASCFNPDTVRDHASYAFNDYYQKNPSPTSCDFGGTAQLANTDPSNGNCHYAVPRTTASLSPPVTTAPTITTPTIMTPSTMTPPIIGTPNGPTVFGEAEPTGQPSSATSSSCSLLFLFSATSILGSLLAGNHI